MYTLKEAYLLARPGQCFKPKGDDWKRGEYYVKQLNGSVEVVVEGGASGFTLSIPKLYEKLLNREDDLAIYAIYENKEHLQMNIPLE